MTNPVRIAEEVAKAEYSRLIKLGMSDEVANRYAEREYGCALVNASQRMPSLDNQTRFSHGR